MGYEANKRWRENNPRIWNAGKKRNYDITRKNAVAKRRPWLPADDECIIADNHATDADLSKTLMRTVQSIQVRRARILKLKTEAP